MENVLSLIDPTGPLGGEFSESEAVLPTQFYGARRGASNIEPMRRLMIAMLVDAVRCFQTKAGADRTARSQEFAEVKSWLFSDDDDGLFSFNAVCDALGLDPKSIRNWLARWQEKRLADAKPRLIRRIALPNKRISR